MKLFQPYLQWDIDGPVHSVALRIVGNDNVSVKLALNRETGEQFEETIPDLPDDEQAPPELHFLFSIFSMLHTPISVFMVHPDKAYSDIALAGLEKVFTELCRSIEYTPRSAEHALLVFSISAAHEVPPALGLTLFADEAAQLQEMEASEFEKSMQEKLQGAENLAEAQRRMMAEMPPLTYKCVVPSVPEAMRKALADEQANMALRHMPAAGSA